MGALSLEALTAAAASVEELLARKREECEGLTNEIKRLERELGLMQELRRIREGNVGSGHSDESSSNAAITMKDDPLTLGVLQILKESGQPVHIQELATRARAVGLRIPGKGANANLIAHIRMCDEIVRPVRGMYALRDWGFVERKRAPRKATRRAGRTPRRVGAAPVHRSPSRGDRS